MRPEEKMWFHNALCKLISMRRLTPQAHVVVYGDDEVFVEEGNKVFTIERISRMAVALVDEDGTTKGKWMVC